MLRRNRGGKSGKADTDAPAPAVTNPRTGPNTGPRTGLYVDTENLQGYARPFIKSLLSDWDLGMPAPDALYLYVRADQQVMWEMWALSEFPAISVNVKGVQHTSAQSKNSADIALSLDAVSDFVLGKAQRVVVVSDDSDFAALFAKMRELQAALPDKPQSNPQTNSQDTPFMWVMTDRDGTKSSALMDFCPNNFIRVWKMRREQAPEMTPETAHVNGNASGSANGSAYNALGLVTHASVNGASNNPSNQEIARAIINGLPTGTFKSTDCQSIIAKHWPTHEFASQDGARFGIWFSASIFPELKEFGVYEPDPSAKPKKFLMPSDAKMRAISISPQ